MHEGNGAGGAPDREEFLRVWRRVMPNDRPGDPIAVYGGAEAPAPVALPDGQDYLSALEGLAARERFAARALRTLARRRRGRVGARLLSLSGESAGRARLLMGEAFLVSGVRICPDGGAPPRLPDDPAAALRACCLCLREAAALYAALVAAAPDDDAAALCRTLCAGAQRQSAALRALTGDALAR